MLLMMELDSVVWFVKGIEDRSEKQERQIDDAQNLRRINQRKEILLWVKYHHLSSFVQGHRVDRAWRKSHSKYRLFSCLPPLGNTPENFSL